jgi:MFS family permease
MRSRGGASPRAVVAVLAGAGLNASFMQTIVIPIQAQLPELLDADPVDTVWVVTVTLLTAAVSTPIVGRLGDMYGRRRVVVVLLALLTIGSILCAVTSDVVLMIVGRALQGIGSGVVPLGIALMRDLLPPDRLSSGVALMSATLGVGASLGLPISAIVVENADWHLLFVLAAVLGAASLALVLLVVPPDLDPAGGRFDAVGAVGLAVGLVAVLLALSRGNAWGWGSPVVLALLVGGIAVLIGWGAVEYRVRDPLVDLRVLFRPDVLLTNIASAAMGFALFASNIVFPQLLELPAAAGGLGVSLIVTAIVLMPGGLVMLVISPLTGRLHRTLGAKTLFVAGALVITAGYIAALALDLQVGHVLLINLASGVGIGLGFAAMPMLIMQAVRPVETGAANGVNTLSRAIGTSSAAAVVGAVLAGDAATGASADPGRFDTAFLLGLIAAIACAVLAALIPRSGRRRLSDPVPVPPTG